MNSVIERKIVCLLLWSYLAPSATFALEEKLSYHNTSSAGYSTFFATNYAHLVKFDLPDPVKNYQLTRLAVFSRGPTAAATFPDNTLIAIRVFSSNQVPIYVSAPVDLTGEDCSDAWRNFYLNPDQVIVSNAFYAGYEQRGAGFSFAFYFDSPWGWNYKRSFKYKVSPPTWSNNDQDDMFDAYVEAVNRLDVSSMWGGAVPFAGTNYLVSGTNISCSVTNSPVSAGTMRYLGAGWVASGSVPTYQPGLDQPTNTPAFTLSSDSSIQWQWSTQYWFSAVAGPGGGIQGATNGWYDLGGSVTVTAAPNAYFHFAGWMGDVVSAANPLQVDFTGPYSITANFAENLTSTGVPQWWLAQYGWTNNFDEASLSDPDGDGMPVWQEYFAGTNPTNNTSYLHITTIAVESNDVRIAWLAGGGRTNVLQATAGESNGAYTTNFVDLSGLIIIPGSGDTSTNYTDAGGATNRPSRFYRIRLVP